MAPLLLGELCRRVDVPYRDARYVLERGLLPEGVDPEPGHGHHRHLTPAQAYWLAIVLKLKGSGVRAPLAAKVADYAREAVRTVGRSLNLDPNFAPFDGLLETEYRWYVELGDLRVIRLVTTANPSGGGRPYEFDWQPLDRGRSRRSPTPPPDPAVVLRVDLGRIAALLKA